MPSSHIAVALIVIDVFISSSGMPSNSVRISPRCGTGHADLADLAPGEHVVGVVAGLGREVEGDRQPGLPLGEVRAVQLVGAAGRGVPRVRADQPGPIGHGGNCCHLRPAVSLPVGREAVGGRAVEA